MGKYSAFLCVSLAVFPSKTQNGFSFGGACRVSPQRARYFLLRRQKKVPKEKATLQSALRVPARARAAAGSEANSLRSNMLHFFIRIDSRSCGALPRGERQHQNQRQHQFKGPHRFSRWIAFKPGFVFDVPPLGTLPLECLLKRTRNEICLSAASLFRFPFQQALQREPEGQRLAVAFFCLLFLARQEK